jgi:diacylglycerol O-acyltransferase / wax synthase
MSTRLLPADAVWYFGENAGNPMMVSSIFWLDREIDPHELREILRMRLVAPHPAFRQRIVPSGNRLSLPHWEDDPDFDIDRHLDVSRLPAPGDHATLEAWCSHQRSTPLDRHRPLWKLHLIQGYRGDRSAVHVRVHHSIGDGWALGRLLLTLVDEAEVHDIQLVDDPLRSVTNGAVRTVGRAAAAAPTLLRHPSRLVDHVTTAAELVSWGIKLLFPTPLPRTVLMGHPTGEKRMVWDPDGIPLDEIRAVGRPTGATINDVLLATLAGALGRFLDQEDSSTHDVMVMVPVSLRRPDEPLPRRLGNKLGLLPVALPVNITDPAARLAEVNRRTCALKGSPAPVVSWALLGATALTTPVVERGIHLVNQAFSTGVVTNVPGPRDPVHLCGARIEGMLGWGGMTAHLNLSWAFFSLDGRVFSGAVTDVGITPEPGRILALFQDEWQHYRQGVPAPV